MQPPEQQTSDSDSPSPSQSQLPWPPKLPRLLIGAALTAAVGLAVLKTLYPIFTVPIDIAVFPEQSPLWMYERLDKAKFEVDGKNLSIVFGIIGALFGLISVVLSYGFKSFKSIGIAVLASGLLAVVGVNFSNTLFTYMRAHSGESLRIMGLTLDGMGQSVLGYSLLWAPIGLGVGLGIGAIRSGKSLVAGFSGLVGGVLGAMVYVLLTAQFSISTVMNQVFPFDSTGQAIWLLLFTAAIAVCIVLGCGEKRPKKATEA